MNLFKKRFREGLAFCLARWIEICLGGKTELCGVRSCQKGKRGVWSHCRQAHLAEATTVVVELLRPWHTAPLAGSSASGHDPPSPLGIHARGRPSHRDALLQVRPVPGVLLDARNAVQIGNSSIDIDSTIRSSVNK